jgi:hypothetical protein
MRSSEPPALATWWLEHLRFGARNDFLLGDLVEEYGQGRSRAWYWRQVLVALLVNFGRELCARGDSLVGFVLVRIRVQFIASQTAHSVAAGHRVYVVDRRLYWLGD